MRILTLLPVLAWVGLWNLLGAYTFGHGRLIAACVAGLVLLQAAAGPLARWLARVSPVVPERAAVGGMVVAAALGFGLHVRALDRALESGKMVDIGRNTLCAGEALFERGTDPYAVRCQMLTVQGAPHVTWEHGRPRMFGVRYEYGYPYFPVMFLAYEPFRQLDGGLDSIRWANGLWLLLAMAGAGWLAARLCPGPQARLAATLGIAVTAAVPVLGYELFQVGVTDLIIAVFALAGFIALDRGHRFAAGALFGLVCAAKLLPGALLLPILAVWTWRSPPGARWRLWLGWAAATAATLLPFVAWDAPAFLSATILYYLSRHAPGDDTSLWFHLPGALQTPFLVAGAAAVGAVLVAGLRRRALATADLLAIWVLSYLTFCCFNKMIHLNYLWSILPLASAGLAAAIASSNSNSHGGDAPRPPALQQPSPPDSARQ
jgi:hypothetical protein